MAQHKLDLDALILEAPRLVAPSGAVATFKAYTLEDLLPMLGHAQGLQKNFTLGGAVALADLILDLCTSEPINRMAIDAVPLFSLQEVMRWLQEATPPTLFMSAEPDGEIVIAGKPHAVRMLTVGAVRQFDWFDTARTEIATTDLADLVIHNADMMAGIIDGLSAAEWRAMPRARTAAIERYIADLMQAKQTEAQAQAEAVAHPKAGT